MQRNGESAGRFAERKVRGVADDGRPELVTIWIERRPGALWAVGRAVDLAARPDGTLRADDYIFEGYEMGDAVEAANDAVRSDVEVSVGEGVDQEVEEFSEQELLRPLERWFFGHSVR
ncbi:MAG: hypothetical protein ACXVYV_03675 [Gaiellales bacterium]